MSFFIGYPFAALVVATAFGALCFAKRNALSGIVAAAWAAYAIYEHLMKTRVLCSGECNIRVDLLLIYPALFLVSAWALLRPLWGLGRRAR